ncbi:hypothetical protein N7495_000139 [Penicillium taxi]|uniref:uncharacterized protein n=1 Tax=Penicillium taxi TaxID=168475 RepID=UPI0025458A30|nr:uncharacterized protein N7495_000139 [Penicillium taxi]KAJ5907457.1 hypothetical protein N7495_000139 [Penicillium taxi]
MSLKQEIETWVAALEAYDNQEFETSLQFFDQIADTSKILFNCGVIYATIGEHGKAVECYQRAVGLDRFLAIAYFQQGVSNFLLGDFEEALANFNDTLLYLRGNTSIDYEQLGLKFRLFSCEVLFNRGLCYVYLRQIEAGMKDLEYAAKEKVTPDHDVIDDAIRENADGYTVFSIPVGVLYRPNAAKVKNLKTVHYLGKARLVAAADRNQNADDQWRPVVPIVEKSIFDDREGMSYAATHLVHRNLSSRTRQQSEPPLSRNVFPPTPPPDDRSSSYASTSGSGHHRSLSLRTGRPPRLDLGTGPSSDNRSVSQERSAVQMSERPRIGTTRTASEPRGPSVHQNVRGFAQESNRWPQSGGHRRNLSDAGSEHASSDLYDPSSSSRGLAGASWGRGTRHQPPQYIAEQDEYECGSDGCDDESREDGFEIFGSAPSELSSPQQRTRSPPRHSRRTNSRRPEVRKFRTKVHAPDDIRYIIIGPAIQFEEFEFRIREKFGFQCPLKMKVQDDGDMITMVDQEDLDLLLTSAREVANREGSDMGKMEVWVEERKVAPPNPIQRQPSTKTADEFLREAYRINSHITSLLKYLQSIRHAYLTTTTARKDKPSHQSNLTDPERDAVDSSTALLLRDLAASISNLSSAESLRQETEASVLRKRYGHTAAGALLWRWAGGAGPLGEDDASHAGKSVEQIRAEEGAKTLASVREGVLWFLRRGLEGAVSAQREMVEKRIERAREKEKSVLYKVSEKSEKFAASSSASAAGVGGSKAQGGPTPDAAFLSEADTARIESQLSPEQLQLFAEENDSMLRHYEDTLGKVQNAEKSLLEISSLQETLVTHLATQEEYISQLVSDVDTTQINVGQGNRELKRATERRSTAQAVFWGTVGLLGLGSVDYVEFNMEGYFKAGTSVLQ